MQKIEKTVQQGRISSLGMVILEPAIIVENWAYLQTTPHLPLRCCELYLEMPQEQDYPMGPQINIFSRVVDIWAYVH